MGRAQKQCLFFLRKPVFEPLCLPSLPNQLFYPSRGWRATRMLVPKGIQRRLEEGLARTMPLLGVFFSVESFSCPSEKDLEWSYLQLRKPGGRLGYKFKRIGQGRTAAEGWRWFDIVTMETRTWWGAWWGCSGELLNPGGVEACAHVGEPSSETLHVLCWTPH